jgi:hypothetical protein
MPRRPWGSVNRQKLPVILLLCSGNIAPPPLAAIRQSLWRYKSVWKHHIMSGIAPCRKVFNEYGYCGLGVPHGQTAWISDCYLSRNIHRLCTTETSFQLFSGACVWHSRFSLTQLYVQTGTDVITQAYCCLTPSSFNVSVLDCL